MSTENNFVTLAGINVSKHVEKKQNMSYLSWSWAVDQLMRHDPAATWHFLDPMVYPDKTMMVHCNVTAFGKTLYMFLPVMDHRNKAIQNPDAFAINKAMMRCLVKGIAVHGLGLYIYAGEDLPEDQKQERQEQARKPQQQNKPVQEQSEHPAPVNQVIDKINKVLVPDALQKTETYINSQPYSQQDKEVLLGALNARRQLLTAQA